MNKTTYFIIRNLWWMVPSLTVLIIWEHTYPILLMLIFAYLGKILLDPFVNILEVWTGNRKSSVFIVMLIFFLFVSILSSSLFPIIGNQIKALQPALSIDTFSKLLMKITIALKNILPKFIYNIFITIINQFDTVLSEIWSLGLTYLKSFIGGAGSLAFALGSAFISFLIIIVFMIIFLLESKKFASSFLHAVPRERYNSLKRMMEKISEQIHSYIRGQLIAAIAVAINSMIGLISTAGSIIAAWLDLGHHSK